MATSSPGLNRSLNVWHVWALAVGLVISGEYFGWNFGWKDAGTIGFLVATVAVTVLYITFIFSYTELTCMYPHAGGPYVYAYKAFGPFGGLIAGYATLMEFIFATPAIAFALGSYIHFLFPWFNVIYTAIGFYIIFTTINIFGIKLSALVGTGVTILAIFELLVYMGIVAPHFEMDKFMYNKVQWGTKEVIAALPYAIWFYLGIEGVAMVSEEVKDTQRTISRGYIFGIFTLTVLVFGVMVLTGGLAEREHLQAIDYPLPAAIGSVLGGQNGLAKFFAGIGLFGLIASFHGIILIYSRQIFALARGRYLPRHLAKIHLKFLTPHIALIAGGLVGVVCLLCGRTELLIILSVLGAIVMYIMSMVSLFILRLRKPEAKRPFISPAYPWFPAIAVILSVVCLGAIVFYNIVLSLVFFGLMALWIIMFMVTGTHKKATH